MESLLERIEENKLDALYLFINETLRDRQEFDHFFQNLLQVLPNNWSIQRVEVGHEFLSMISDDPQRQETLFQLICGLESLKGLIISDGYIPRKDNGTIDTDSFLMTLPRARNLQYMDIQRLRLQDETQVDLLATVFESLAESLEEIRLTSLSLGKEVDSLDPAIQVCVEMSNLRSLAISCSNNNNNTAATTTTAAGNAGNNAAGTNNNSTETTTSSSSASSYQQDIISQGVLLELCQSSTTLQDLALRSMYLTDTTCQTISDALITNSFLTSLDIRQNPQITTVGYKAIVGSLERNYDLWCSVMVDNDSFQAKFNALIELNQANRGDLVRSPTRTKLADFLIRLQENHHIGGGSSGTSVATALRNDDGDIDPTSLWYFLTIHDSILHPLVNFLKWKTQSEDREEQEKKIQQRQEHVDQQEPDTKRPRISDT